MTNDKNDILTPIKKRKLGNLHRLPNSTITKKMMMTRKLNIMKEHTDSLSPLRQLFHVVV